LLKIPTIYPRVLNEHLFDDED